MVPYRTGKAADLLDRAPASSAAACTHLQWSWGHHPAYGLFGGQACLQQQSMPVNRAELGLGWGSAEAASQWHGQPERALMDQVLWGGMFALYLIAKGSFGCTVPKVAVRTLWSSLAQDV